MFARRKIRTILPMVQVAIAAALIISNLSRPDTWEDPAWTHLDIQYCWALNSPAAAIAYLQRVGMYDLLKDPYPLLKIVNLGIFFPLVWLLWYAVGIEIGGRGLSVLTPKTGYRRLADALAMAFGLFGFGVLISADKAAGQIIYWPYWDGIVPVHLMWALAIVGFYGHDLWASFRTNKK
jgi:hypothetical protein